MATIDEELRTAVHDYVENECRSGMIGRFYSTSDPDDVDAFADWFADFALKAVRWHTERQKQDA